MPLLSQIILPSSFEWALTAWRHNFPNVFALVWMVLVVIIAALLLERFLRKVD